MCPLTRYIQVQNARGRLVLDGDFECCFPSVNKIHILDEIANAQIEIGFGTSDPPKMCFTLPGLKERCKAPIPVVNVELEQRKSISSRFNERTVKCRPSMHTEQYVAAVLDRNRDVS